MARAGKNRRVWAISGVGIPENMQKTQCGLQKHSFLRSEVWTEFLGGQSLGQSPLPTFLADPFSSSAPPGHSEELHSLEHHRNCMFLPLLKIFKLILKGRVVG